MRRHRHRKYSAKTIIGAAVFAVILVLLAAALRRTDKALRPVAAMQAEHFASASANELIGKTVAEYLEDNRFTYNDFAAVLYDEGGRVVSVESIPYNINKVQSELTIKVNEALSSSDSRTERIPVGSLTGSYMLVGKGPHIKLKVCPSGSAKVELKSDLVNAGINQTCHRISAVITAELRSSVPLYTFDTEVKFEFLLAENVLVGSVPEISRYAFGTI
jgi:sporulation protein YunB